MSVRDQNQPSVSPRPAPTLVARQGIDRWIPVIRPHLAESLVDHPALERLRPIARSLPGDALAVLEVSLASGTAVADFSVRLATPAQAESLPEAILLPHQRTFLRRWSQQPSGFASVSSVWLEFDLDRDLEGLPAPIICTRLRSGFELDWLVDELFPALHGQSMSRSQDRLIRHCLAELPSGLTVLYAFSLRPRPGDAVRLELFGRDLATMIDYLGRLGSPGAAQRVEDLSHLVEDGERFHLSFDLAAEVAPRIGIECGFERQPRREPRWAGLFDRLVENGLCVATKRDAVLRWPGYDSLWTATDRWPEDASPADGYCVRGLSHIKLVSGSSRGVEAKAYMVFQSLSGREPPDL